MQRPVGYQIVDGRAELTSVGDLLTNRFAVWAFAHVILVGLTTASAVVFGIACWHFARGRNQEIFRKAAKLALIVLVPVSAINLGLGSHLGVVTTEDQPMKIAATEAQWDTCQPCAFSIFQIGGFSESDQTPSFSIEIPKLLSFLATGSFNGKVDGMLDVQDKYRAKYGPGDYVPNSFATYWSMRIMAYLGTLVFLVSAVGAFLYRRRKLETTRWFQWVGVATIPLPFLAALAGWVLTEMGRQPWIVQGLLKTSTANSPSVGSTTIWISLAVFASLYGILAIVDFALMRHFARLDPPDAIRDEDGALPALSY
jgi:cytochrome d ubiquinol oxidase subunit I